MGILKPVLVSQSLKKTLDLEPCPKNVSVGRNFVRQTLEDWGCDPGIIESAVLLATEMLTNGVLHARTELTVEIEYNDPHVDLSVKDGSPLLPVGLRSIPEAGTGRGLSLVAALSGSWGISSGEKGKTVWARIDSAEPKSDVSIEVLPEKRLLIELPDVPATLFLALEAHDRAVVRELELVKKSSQGLGDASISDISHKTAQLRAAICKRVERIARELGNSHPVRLELAPQDAQNLLHWHEAMAAADELCRSNVLLSPPASSELTDLRRRIHAHINEQKERPPEQVSQTNSWVNTTESLKLIIEHAPIGMIIANLEGKFLRVNPAMCKILGRTEQELLGMSYKEITHPDDIATCEANLGLACRDGISSYTFEKRYIHADGNPVPVMMHVSILRSNSGEPQDVISQVEDISKRRADDAATKEKLDLAADSQRDAAERSTIRLALLQAVTARLSQARDAQDVNAAILREISGLLGAHACALWSKRTDSFKFHDSWGWPTHINSSTELAPACQQELLSGKLVEIELIVGNRERLRCFLIPLRLKGNLVGALGLGWPGARRTDDDDVRLLLAIGDQCAQAIERARLHEAERRAIRRQEILAAAGRSLTSSLDLQATVNAVAALFVPAIADTCTVLVEEHDLLVPKAHIDRDGSSDGKVPSAITLELSKQAASSHEPVITDLASDLISRMDIPPLEEKPPSIAMAVPLVARGKLVGVLHLTWQSRHPQPSEPERELIWELSERSALAIDNANSFQLRAEVANTLQRSLLPRRVPQIPGAEIAACYQPAMTGVVEVGGDFYDAFESSDDWVLVLGDVCGKGASAAALTAMARYSIRLAAMSQPSPAGVLHSANEAMLNQIEDDRFCTVCYLRVVRSASGLRVTVCSAGHPLPMVLRANGEVTPVGIAGGLLGLFPDIRLGEETTELHQGDTIVLYTDGVTEAHGSAGLFGEERLAKLLSANAGRTAQETIDAIAEEVLQWSTGRRDDLALLALKVT